jgi:hypothetical protein
VDSAVALLALMSVHVLASSLRFLDAEPRSAWLSAAGGISVAYVMVHLLPELGSGQDAIDEGVFGLEFLENHVYLMALVGLGLFYWVELASRPSSRGATGQKFWFGIGSFAIYNAFIGYLVVHRQDQTGEGLALFAVAMGLHFIVNDHALRERHEETYDSIGRWVLVAAIAVGWALGEATDISEAALGLLVAFIGGGVILNVMKEELPEDRESRFWAFALGAGAYAALLQLM